MTKTVLRTEAELSALYDRHKDMVYRVCFAYMKNPADTEDAVQETFIRLIQAEPLFENAVNEKAWLIRTATNICENHLLCLLFIRSGIRLYGNRRTRK
ncbi:MAG: RNA polymerase sigma factor [Lachnospiraceae bacterium]|nr:RNA polymerase sigma factor [Lachnospiraceae bacterium]